MDKDGASSKMKRKAYEKQLRKLQVELCHLQEWVKVQKFKVIILKHAPWRLVRSDDKRRARLNVISHILKTIPYKKIARNKVKLPKRSSKGSYNDQASLRRMKFLEERY